MVLQKWERVNKKKDLECTQRLKVYGGWLVLTTIEFDQASRGSHYDTVRTDQYTIAQSFIPDPNHEWKLGE